MFTLIQVLAVEEEIFCNQILTDTVPSISTALCIIVLTHRSTPSF